LLSNLVKTRERTRLSRPCSGLAYLQETSARNPEYVKQLILLGDYVKTRKLHTTTVQLPFSNEPDPNSEYLTSSARLEMTNTSIDVPLDLLKNTAEPVKHTV
jgi:hypothetical protein